MIEQFGRVIITMAVVLLVVGVVLVLVGRYAPSGRLLPGDIVIQRPGLTFYFPLATMIVVSVLLSGIMWLISYLRR